MRVVETVIMLPGLCPQPISVKKVSLALPIVRPLSAAAFRKIRQVGRDALHLGVDQRRIAARGQRPVNCRQQEAVMVIVARFVGAPAAPRKWIAAPVRLRWIPQIE